MAGSLVAGGDQQHTAVFHTLDLPVQQAKLGWVALVVRRIDRQYHGPNPLQARRRIVVARRIPLVQDVVRVRRERCAQALVEHRVGLFARRRRFVKRLSATAGGYAEEHRGELRATRLLRVVAIHPLRIGAYRIDDQPAQHPVAAGHFGR